MGDWDLEMIEPVDNEFKLKRYKRNNIKILKDFCIRITNELEEEIEACKNAKEVDRIRRREIDKIFS